MEFKARLIDKGKVVAETTFGMPQCAGQSAAETLDAAFAEAHEGIPVESGQWVEITPVGNGLT